jgi:putative endonuclease
MKYMYVYILECADGSYYTGVTNDLERRIKEHNLGIDRESYTYLRRPLTLKHYEYFTDPEQAIMWEKKIKGWSRRKKKAMIEGD